MSEDLGPGGCQLVTPHLVPAGNEVRLSIELPGQGRTVEGTAMVVWSRAAQPSRLGLRFATEAPDRNWLEPLLAVEPRLASAARRRPSGLPWRARLFLGRPPMLIVDFTRDELAVLRRIRPGITVVELVASFGRSPERLVGALFALVGRRQIVLEEGASAGPDSWSEVLAEAEAAEGADGITLEHPLPELLRDGPQTDAQRLVAEGREHLAAGRLSLAAERFRQARILAPDDKDARAELRKMGRFG